MLPVKSRNPQDTVSAGESIAQALTPGTVVALYGDLGAGKTEFVRGVCSGLGIDGTVVSSPTFAIVNEYPTGSLPVYHFDVYRMKDIDELFELGYEDYFFGSGVCLVEWPSRIEALLPEGTIRICIRHNNGDRDISLLAE